MHIAVADILARVADFQRRSIFFTAYRGIDSFFHLGCLVNGYDLTIFILDNLAKALFGTVLLDYRGR